MHPITIAIERRLSRRYTAVPNEAVVEFTRRGKARIVGARLVDISATGALLRMSESPPVGELLWVRLVHPVRTSELMATAVRTDDAGGVGVAFGRSCDRTFYWTATRGEDFRSDAPGRFMAAEAVSPGT
jgi:hypothetical protein